MKNFIKKLILTIILVALLITFGVVGYYAYTDIKASVAKEYLMERYGFDKKEILATKSTEYVYEDIANCETLWIKKCTDDKTLHYKHTFKLKDGTEIHVTEDIDRNFIDDYKGEVKKYNRQDEIQAQEAEKSKETTNTEKEKK